MNWKNPLFAKLFNLTTFFMWRWSISIY